MHELSLAEAIAATTSRHAGGRPVAAVQVRIGHLRQVVPDSLQFAWELLVSGTELDGARLEIHHVPAVVRCGACGAATTLEVAVFACGACGSVDVALETGDEFTIDTIDVAEIA